MPQRVMLEQNHWLCPNKNTATLPMHGDILVIATEGFGIEKTLSSPPFALQLFRLFQVRKQSQEIVKQLLQNGLRRVAASSL